MDAKFLLLLALVSSFGYQVYGQSTFYPYDNAIQITQSLFQIPGVSVQLSLGGNTITLDGSANKVFKVLAARGCINLGTENSDFYTLTPIQNLPLTDSDDPTLLCPFYSILNGRPSDTSTLSVLYQIIPQNDPIALMISSNISAQSDLYANNPPAIVSSFVITWVVASTPTVSSTVKFQVALAVVNGTLDTYAIFNYGTIPTNSGGVMGGVNMGNQGGWLPLPNSNTTGITSWSNKQYIFQITNILPQLIGCLSDPTQVTSLTISSLFASGYASQRLSVHGPCFTPGVALQIFFKPRVGFSKASTTTNVTGVYVSTLTSIYRQPIIPELEPGWYTVSMMMGTQMLSATGIFYLVPITTTNVTGSVILKSPNSWLNLNPSTTDDFSITWDPSGLRNGPYDTSLIEIVLLAYPQPYSTNLNMQQMVEFSKITHPNTGYASLQYTSFNCTLANCADYHMGQVAVRVPWTNASVPIPSGNSSYVEYRSLPTFFGGILQNSDKNSWLNGKCSAWMSAHNTSVFKMRNDPSVNVNFQCPCTLDWAQADQSFGVSDYLCTGSYCIYSNYINRPNTQCLLSLGMTSKGYGLRCCYDTASRNLLYTQDLMNGYSYMNMYHLITLNESVQPGAYDFLSFYLHDYSGWYSCCSTSGTSISTNCANFVEFKAVPSQCKSYGTAGSATVSGEPHFVTLDGTVYTFNGAGEYTYLVTNDTNLNIQVRLSRLSMICQGGVQCQPTATVTVMTSMAIGYVNYPTVEIRINPSSGTLATKKLVIIINGVEFLFQGGMGSVGGLDITTSTTDQSQVMVKFLTDQLAVSCQYIPITNSYGTWGEMNCRVQVPYKYINQTTGLLGQWDNNPTNDLQPCNVTWPAPVDATNMVQVYYTFGLSCKISSQSHSLFTYLSGETFLAINSPLASPQLSMTVPINPAINDNGADINSSCLTGNGSLQCIFDGLWTGSKNTGLATLQAIKTVQQDKSTIVTLNAMVVCPQPNIQYAKPFTFTNWYLQGSVATFDGCQSDFYDVDSGSSSSCTCQADGTWGSCNWNPNRCSTNPPVVTGAPVWVIVVAVVVPVILILVIIAIIMPFALRRRPPTKRESGENGGPSEVEMNPQSQVGGGGRSGESAGQFQTGQIKGESEPSYKASAPPPPLPTKDVGYNYSPNEMSPLTGQHPDYSNVAIPDRSGRAAFPVQEQPGLDYQGRELPQLPPETVAVIAAAAAANTGYPQQGYQGQYDQDQPQTLARMVDPQQAYAGLPQPSYAMPEEERAFSPRGPAPDLGRAFSPRELPPALPNPSRPFSPSALRNIDPNALDAYMPQPQGYPGGLAVPPLIPRAEIDNMQDIDGVPGYEDRILTPRGPPVNARPPLPPPPPAAFPGQSEYSEGPISPRAVAVGRNQGVPLPGLINAPMPDMSAQYTPGYEMARNVPPLDQGTGIAYPGIEYPGQAGVRSPIPPPVAPRPFKQVDPNQPILLSKSAVNV